MAEAALEGRPDGAHEEGPEEGIAKQATQDDFLDGITQTEGPLALYKQNRLSGRYRRVHPSTPWRSQAFGQCCGLPSHYITCACRQQSAAPRVLAKQQQAGNVLPYCHAPHSRHSGFQSSLRCIPLRH